MVMRLTIHNETGWRGDDLRRLFRAGLVACGADSRRTIWVQYHRDCRRWISVRGLGKYGEWWGDVYSQGWGIRMWVPHPGFVQDQIDGEVLTVKQIAQVFEHEVYHTLGMTHREMARDLRWCKQSVPWSEGLRLRPRADRSRAAAGSSGR